MKLLKQFINSNYYQDKKYKYVYSDKQLAFLFNKSNKNIKIMTINDKTRIIGCITSRINKVLLNNNIINIGYIDFMYCQKYRNQLAPILISNILY